MSEFRKPLPEDSMEDHAEQHGHAYDEIEGLKTKDVELENKININEDRIATLNYELDAIAESRVGGEWILSSDSSTQGTMALGTQDLTGFDNRLYINVTDANGIVVNMDSIEVGDYIEIVEEHEVLNRATQDYGLYKVTVAYVDNYFDLELSEGRGFADLGRRFFIKAFKMSDSFDIAELDSRYSMKVHSHENYSLGTHTHSQYLTSLPSHTHNYASSSHTHSYASTSHIHSSYSEKTHTHSVIFRSGTSSSPTLSKGEPYINTSTKVMYVGL